VPDSPLAPHLATPAELQARLHAARHGAPFLVLRHPNNGQMLVSLGDQTRITIGRRAECDIATEWDGRVSRLHAELVLIGGEWILTDDGLSANGTRVNDAALNKRRRLRDGDLVRVGDTIIAYCSPADLATATLNVDAASSIIAITPAQRRVLVALCRPYLQTGALAAPANAELAAELFLSVDSVKTHMKALFVAFGLDDSPSRIKRASLIEQAVRLGIISPRDIADRSA
jgi:predicted component of type VI protein secretion system